MCFNKVEGPKTLRRHTLVKNSITQINGRFHQKNQRNIQRKWKTLRDRRKNQIANAKFSNKPCGALYKNIYDSWKNVGKRAFVGSSQKNAEKVPFASIKLSLKNLSKKRKKPRIYRGFTACIFFSMLSCAYRPNLHKSKITVKRGILNAFELICILRL